MDHIKQKLESAFADFGHFSFRYPWLMVVIASVLLVFLSWHTLQMRSDTSTEGFMKPDDPALAYYNAFRDEFGRDEIIVVALEVENFYNTTTLSQFKQLHQRLETQVPYIVDVKSLVNARHIYGLDDELFIDDLLENLPQGKQALEQLKITIAQQSLYKNFYISADQKIITLMLTPAYKYDELDPKTGEKISRYLGDEQLNQIVTAIKPIVKEYDALGIVHLAGSPTITHTLNVLMFEDMARFVVAAIIMIALVLVIMFRRLSTMIMPMLVVVCALVSTLGIMSLMGQPLQLPTVMLPSFVLAVGVGDSIHFISQFLRILNQGKTKQDAIAGALKHTGLPMFFTSITTAAGLLSFAQSDILPVANIGIYSAIGVMFAFVYTVLLLPSLMALVPVKSKASDKGRSLAFFDAFINTSIRFSHQYSLAISVSGVALLIAAVLIAAQLQFSHNPLIWLPETTDTRVATQLIDDRLGGSIPVEMIVDSGEIDGIKDPEFLRRIDQLKQEMLAYQGERIHVGKVLTISDMLKETNQALFSGEAKDYRIPDDRNLIAQELLLLESGGADDLFKLVDRNYQKARVTLYLPWTDALYFAKFLVFAEAKFEQKFENYNADVRIQATGLVPLLARTLEQIMTSTAISYGIALFVITLMMIMLLGSVKYGLVSMLPNVLPISMAMALMKITGAPLDLYSMMIGSIALGLSVDDTVHFMHGFQRNYLLSGDAKDAVAKTLHTTGRAMFSTSIVLAAGFFIYLLSDMSNLYNFGLFTGLCAIVALLADFWIAPAIMILMHPKK